MRSAWSTRHSPRGSHANTHMPCRQGAGTTPRHGKSRSTEEIFKNISCWCGFSASSTVNVTMKKIWKRYSWFPQYTGFSIFLIFTVCCTPPCLCKHWAALHEVSPEKFACRQSGNINPTRSRLRVKFTPLSPRPYNYMSWK